ncbi:uncharacterized protein LODBEIA_P37860 [Lodderomyces beijingensis]|uniref:Uncharacterized protein n=1 Tax=Lodderomyces beijingensis TaxID=1775926 RepID=A0ABP0ZQF8_9ASCO
MKFLFALLSFCLLGFSIAQAINADWVDQVLKRGTLDTEENEFWGPALEKRATPQPSQETFEEIDRYLKQLLAYATGNYSDVSKRFDQATYPLLLAAFKGLNETGTGVSIVHGIVTNSATQGTAITAIEQYIKQNTLATLLTAADNSNLAVAIVMRFFVNNAWTPGLWNIVVGLYNNGVLFKRLLGDIIGGVVGGVGNIIGGIVGGVQQSIWSTLLNLLNIVADVETVCKALEVSGFGVSVVEDIVTTSDGQGFAIKAASSVIKDGIITLDSLFSALNKTSFLQNTFTKIISNSTYRQIIFVWAVNFLVSMIRYIF